VEQALTEAAPPDLTEVAAKTKASWVRQLTEEANSMTDVLLDTLDPYQREIEHHFTTEGQRRFRGLMAAYLFVFNRMLYFGSTLKERFSFLPQAKESTGQPPPSWNLSTFTRACSESAAQRHLDARQKALANRLLVEADQQGFKLDVLHEPVEATAKLDWRQRYTLMLNEVLKKAETDMKVGNVKTGTGMLDYLLKWTDSYPLKPNLKYEDFSWEARGFRAPKGAPILTVFPQEGTFRALPGEQGEVGFKVPYATSPNVELSSSFHVHENLVIVECRPTGFKWKSVAKDPNDRGDVVWKAKGIRATEIPKSKPETP